MSSTVSPSVLVEMCLHSLIACNNCFCVCVFLVLEINKWLWFTLWCVETVNWISCQLWQFTSDFSAIITQKTLESHRKRHIIKSFVPVLVQLRPAGSWWASESGTTTHAVSTNLVSSAIADNAFRNCDLQGETIYIVCKRNNFCLMSYRFDAGWHHLRGQWRERGHSSAPRTGLQWQDVPHQESSGSHHEATDSSQGPVD